MLTAEQANLRFQRTVALLRDPEASFTADAIYSLSDLTGEHLEAFHALWPELPADRRRDLILRLVETAETNFELDFSTIIEPALRDPDYEVRMAAVEGILEDAALSTVRRLMRLAKTDTFEEVRAAAVKALGQFVLRGELGKLPEPFNTELQDLVLALHTDTDEPLDVRRRALEAIGNCGRDGVSELIVNAYRADELLMRVSALFAMGRSCDDVWLPHIVAELSSDHPEMRYEAARAAGELELRPALARLAELAFEDDREIQEMAIWALGEIGGKEANRVLTQLAALADSTDDDVLADAIAEAQSVATLSGSDLLPLFDFSSFDDEDEEDDDFLLSLDELDDEDLDDYDVDDELDDEDDLTDIDEPDYLDAEY
jgi:HEAT repeat protein